MNHFPLWVAKHKDTFIVYDSTGNIIDKYPSSMYKSLEINQKVKLSNQAKSLSPLLTYCNKK